MCIVSFVSYFLKMKWEISYKNPKRKPLIKDLVYSCQ